MDLLKNKTFCMAPWVHAYLGPNNERNLCSISNADFGDKNELSDTWNGEKMKEIRRDLIAGKEIKECERCALNMEHNYRKYWNYKFYDIIPKVLKNTDKDGTFNGTPISVDYRTNICNFKCRMCNPIFSSAIFQEFVKLGLMQDEQITKLKKQFENNRSLIKKELDFLIDTGELIDMYWAGGEPLYFKEHWDSLKKLIENGKSENVWLRYSTNLSSLTWKDQNIVDYLNKFKHTEMMCSLDGTGEIGEWVRTNLNYEKWLSNFKELQKFRDTYPDKLKLIISTVLTVPTFLDLPNINRLANEFDVEIQLQEAVGTYKLLMLRNYPKNIILNVFDKVKNEIILDGGRNAISIINFIDFLSKETFYDDITMVDVDEIKLIEKQRLENITFENIISINEDLKNFYLSIVKKLKL